LADLLLSRNRAAIPPYAYKGAVVTSVLHHASHLEDVIRAEFSEMPGMRLTIEQTRRLWGLTPEDANQVIEHLIKSGFLVRAKDGRYCRRLDLL
jgi:Fic family protein